MEREKIKENSTHTHTHIAIRPNERKRERLEKFYEKKMAKGKKNERAHESKGNTNVNSK